MSRDNGRDGLDICCVDGWVCGSIARFVEGCLREVLAGQGGTFPPIMQPLFFCGHSHLTSPNRRPPQGVGRTTWTLATFCVTNKYILLYNPEVCL